MLIRSKHTNLEHTVTAEEWEQIKKDGKSGKYTVVNSGDAASTDPPEEVANSNYIKLIEDGKKAYKEKRYAEAKELYTQAGEVKPSAHITTTLEKIEAKLEKEA